MIALSEHLRNHGYDPRIEKHTSIPGIWAKLSTLYDLDVIDERENSFEYEEPKKYVEFQLPLDPYFQEKTLDRSHRIGSDAPSSPSSPPQLQLSDSSSPEPETVPKKRKRAETISKQRASTVDDTDATTTPAHSPPKSTRSGRGTNKAVGRMKAESRSRQESKDTTADEDEDAEETEEVGEDDEPDAEEEEDGTLSPKAAKPGPKAKATSTTTRKSKRKR